MTNVSDRLPPRRVVLTAEEADARKEERERKEAQIRGVASIPRMREAIKQASRAAPMITEIPRLRTLNSAEFRARAEIGLPFLIDGIVNRWPLAALPPHILREQYSHMPVRARVGDYVNNAFAADRPMQDMTMGAYLDVVDAWTEALPPYLGNLELRELNSQCHWPTYFDKMGPPRFWVGPAGTVTPLHCDYDDNIFAQIWGTKRIWLAPAHHDEYLYSWQANSLLYGSPFNPEAPDYEQFPLARQARLIECMVHPGDMLYVPAGWYHQVNALTFSLSSNRWARGVPFAVSSQSTLTVPATAPQPR